MVLQRLHLQRFGPFREGQWEFAPGLNVVRGPNEAGKSHLREAIVRLFFDQTKVTSKAQELSRWTTWGEDRDFVIAGEFLARDQTWRIEKDFAADTILLAAADGSEALHDGGPINERLHELIGVNTRAVYTSTACVEQQNFAELQAGREIGELLQRTIAGGGAETRVLEVLEKLEGTVRQLEIGVRGAYKRPGPIRAAQDFIADTDREISNLARRVNDAKDAQARLEVGRERLTELRSELKQAEALLKAADERNRLVTQRDQLQKRCEELARELRTANELKSKLEQLETDIAKLPQLPPEEIARIEDLHRQMQAARQQAEQLAAQADSLDQQAAEARKELSRAEAGAMPPELLGQVTDLNQTIVERELRAREDDARVAELNSELAVASRRATLALGLFVGALALIVAGVTLGTALATPLYGLIALGIGAGAWAFKVRPTRPGILIAQELAQAEQQLQDAQAQLAAARAELQQLLEPWGVSDMRAIGELIERSARDLAALRDAAAAAQARAEQLRQQAETKAAQADELHAQLQQALEAAGFPDNWEGWREACGRLVQLQAQHMSLSERLRGLLGDRTAEELSQELSTQNLDRLALNERLQSAEMQTAKLSGEQYQQLVSRVTALSEQTAELEQELARLELVAQDPEADAERLRVLQERKAAAEERLALLCERRDALKLAYELLEEANRETVGRAVEHLAPRMSEYLAPLTAGRYCQVRIDHTDLRPQVFCPIKGDVLDLDHEASCATREQVYLAARLALTSLLWPDEMPPILLDDPLVNFDPERHAAAVTMLRAFAQQAQVIVFTCHDWYDAAADHILAI